jgi:hypothetical protein
MSFISQPTMIRQSSLENFTNTFFQEEREIEHQWASVLYGEMPASPASSSSSELQLVNPVEDDLDNLLNEVLSAHDSDESNPPSPANSSDGSLIQEAASNASIIPFEYVPDIEASLQTLNQANNYNAKSEPPAELSVQPMDTSMPITYVVTSDQDYIINSQIKTSPPPSVGPLSPATSISTVDSPNPDKAARKRVQNKASSKRYREKIKDRENSMFEAIETLQNRKRIIELELAKTKAVNSFLVDQLKQKFGAVLG